MTERATFSLTNTAQAWRLDAVCLEERHTDTATITEHPVERGGAVTEYVRQDPSVLVVRLAVSNQPTRYTTPLRQIAIKRPTYPTTASPAAALNGLAAAAGLPTADFPQGIQTYAAPDGDAFIEAYSALRTTMANAEIVQVVTGVRLYTDLLISGIEVTRTGSPGDELVLSFRPLRVVEYQAIDTPSPVREPALAARTNVGTQAPQPATAPAALANLDLAS